MGVSIPNFICAFLVLPMLAGCGLGRLARRSWRFKDEPALDRFVLDTALGLGLLSFVFFTMAALHLLSGIAVYMVCVALALALGVPLVACAAGLGIIDWVKGRNRPPMPSWKTVVWVILFSCLALVVLIPAMAPPSGSDWDSLAYHLSIPKLYLQHGGLYYIDFASHSNFPLLVEMLYTPALSINDPAGAKMVHYLYGVLLVLAVVMLVRKHFAPKAVPLAALAIAGMPIVMWEATTAYIDLATALYTVAAVYLLLDYLDKPGLRSLIWCGVAAGFAASTKMTGLTLIPILVMWLVIDRWFAGKRVEWKPALLLAGVGLLVCSPWYIKSLIYTGNPVYPFFYSIFGGKDWTQELAQTYTALQGQFGVGHDFGSFMLLPFDLTFRWTEFCDKGQPWLFVGPILLVAVPLLFAAKCWSRKLKGLLLFFLAQMAVWFALTEQSRYLISAFAILAVIIAAVAYSDERFRITRIALYVTFAATALFGVWVLMPFIRSAAPVVFGSEKTDQYLTRTLPVYPAEKWINDHSLADAKVALFGDTRGFYLDRDYVWADWGHNKRFTRSFASADEFVSYLKRQGITHAMVNFRVLPSPGSATGTAKLVYEAIDQKRFERVGDMEPTTVGVYKIR